MSVFPTGEGATPEEYTAVVYFHGMGQQRRHEEVSNLVQQLDLLVAQRHREDPIQYPNPHLIDHHVGEEPGSDPSDPPAVVYQAVRHPRAVHPTPPDGIPSTPWIRFYEAYWAPQAVGGTNAVSVLLWATRQWLQPLAVLRAPWREMQVLRLATLNGLYERRYERHGDQLSPRQRQSVAIVQHLIDCYRGFVDPATYVDPRFPTGTFPEFLQYLAEHPPVDSQVPLTALQITTWAHYWRREHIRQQWQYVATTLVLMLALFGLLALAVGGLSVLLGGPFHALLRFLVYEIAVATKTEVLTAQPTAIAPTVLGRLMATYAIAKYVLAQVLNFLLQAKASLAAVIAAGVVAILLSPFRDYLGDVQQYVTYQETDRKYRHKEAILQNTTAVLQHVLRDERCQRIVVVSHSLGTVIAFDTLLGLHHPQRVTATPRVTGDSSRALAKITHFVTMASPINKVEYFFATMHSKIPIYLKVVSELRGDLSTVPFSYRGQPHIHWVNYWDQGDIVSGPLHTVMGTQVDIRHQRVDNVRIASYRWPNPVRSHTGYLHDLNVLRDIYDMIFDGKYSFVPGQPQHWLEDIYRPEETAGLQDWQRVGLVTSLLSATVALYAFLLWFVDHHPLFTQLVVLMIALVIVVPFLWGLVRLVARLRSHPPNQAKPSLGESQAPTVTQSNTRTS